MIWALLAGHAVICMALPIVGARLAPRTIFAIAAVAPLVTVLVILSRFGDAPETASLTWVAGLDLEFAFRLDPLSGLLALIVSGIGVGVFVYSAGYFSPDTDGLPRFAATLLAFSVSMLGLVLADSIWTLFVFWELTSITSFLLVGFKNGSEAARLAARRAFLITAAGGLVLLAGLLVFADAAGTTSLRDLDPVVGTAASVAAILVLVAAATKSAQVPFHVWLPGAMSAPTPVSAYLHSATMVKAGIIVVALLLPALGETDVWTPLGLAFGLSSMLWGAIGALRQNDAKLILAWGTISQLGLMMALLAVDTPKATFAALSILVAHAVFKAALFMVVGEIDVRTGTRDIRRLAGLWRPMPIAFAVALVSGLSMAGVPPMLGFPAKEAAVEAALGLTGTERAVVLLGVVGGSILTVAYTVRFLVGTFGGPAPDGLEVGPRRVEMTGVTVTLGVASFAGFVALGSVTTVVRDAAVIVDPGAAVYSLLRWPGWTTAFAVSVAIVVVGAVVGLVAVRRDRRTPRPIGADVFDAMVGGTLDLARRICGVVQHGSLPVYMVTVGAVTALAATPFLLVGDRSALYSWDHPVQAVLVVQILAAAVGVVLVPTRLGAALGLGAVGFGVAGLFIVQGAPDLALTQLLVETVIVVGFVIGLGRLGREFRTFGRVWRGIRVAVSAILGTAVGAALVASGSASVPRPPLDELAAESTRTGGGNNVVNVILTDMRALDTFGEIVVLVVVAVGVVALARAGRSATGGRAREPESGHPELVDPRERSFDGESVSGTATPEEVPA